MPPAVDKPTMLALAALYALCDAARLGPVVPSLEVRALLALVHRLGNGDRAPFDEFWRISQELHAGDTAGGYVRATYMRTEWMGIARTLGLQPEASVFHDQIADLVRKQRAAVDPEHRARMLAAAALLDAKHRRDIVSTKGHPHSERGQELIKRGIYD